MKIKLSIITLLFILIAFCINFYILIVSRPYILESEDILNIPKKHVALVLGAKVYHETGKMSDMFFDRATTALELYKNKKVEKILISGDHGKIDYDEVGIAKEFFIKEGVAPQDIFLDHAGFDTYDSIYRAKEVFKVESIIITTQNFHLPRAIYIAKYFGMDVYGLSADKHTYRSVKYNEAREILARVKSFTDTIFHAKPKFLGDIIPISGDGQKSWD